MTPFSAAVRALGPAATSHAGLVELSKLLPVTFDGKPRQAGPTGTAAATPTAAPVHVLRVVGLPAGTPGA